jgi:leucyl aminopeptidase (aminopeptidase T)
VLTEVMENHAEGHIKDFMVVEGVDRIGTLAHKDRLAILEALSDRPKTGAEVARELDQPANRIHYHLRQLLTRGFIAEVGKGRKRWKEARYFRATARHFIVDPRIGCRDEGTSASLIRSIDTAFLDWRREELLKIDLGRIAQIIVHEALVAKPRDEILVMHGSHGFDLAELIYVELQTLGCRSHTRIWSYHTVMSTLNHNTVESLKSLPFIPPEVDADLNGVIFISSGIPGGPPPDRDQIAKLPSLLDSISRWQRSLPERGVRYVEFSIPARHEFEEGERTPEEAISAFWGCIEVDRERIRRRAEKILAIMEGRPQLRFTSSRGTDLNVEVDLERAFVLDGRIDQEDVVQHRVFEGLPAGTLNFFPIPASVNGVYCADYTLLSGMRIEHVTLEIRKGRIVELRAQKNEDLLRMRLEKAVGDADLISGVRFGLNPAGRGPTGKPILDACLAGTVTLHFGNNELQGGDVKSTINLILPSCHLTVISGKFALVDSGELAHEICEA